MPDFLKIELRAFPGPLASRHPVMFEFHILRSARDLYDFDESLFTFNGNVIIPNFRAARIMAQKINDRRTLPGQHVRPGQLNAMGLIDEIYHFILRTYEELVNPSVFAKALKDAASITGEDALEGTLKSFTSFYPPVDVYRKKTSVSEFLAGSSGTKQHREITIEEIILLYFANINPAFAPFRELFDDRQLSNETAYTGVIERLEKFFQREPPFGPDLQPIFELLRAPILASPDSLEGQLAFIRSRWGMILSKRFMDRIASAGDFMKEDFRVITPGGPPPTVVPRYGRGADEYSDEASDVERFSQDLDWMPNVVLIAKNTYVWLDQLSKQYRRTITRLDQIPDEELDRMAGWNFTSLWLIGIWERSSASRKIKQMTGNPEAAPSAYSVFDYIIANDLGGEEAFNNLRYRAWQRGIRLAGDMVPNHMGLFSKWVIDHPDYFIQCPQSPFPNYRFTGADLSDDPTVQLRIEDGYWNRSDAAVVFQRIDNRNGEVRYIYHGNDGTSYPWNDTAQLDFLRHEVREAVIQTIFHVARKFSVIRFDAAMVLAKKHFQRLWYPQPGSGGDIPSRADYAMTREDFNTAFPTEFWREVVDRINQEMPNTLLLAEAFWLLEGYFVRTLGMHRVYNSAFMHMLMKEENAKYREAIRNTLHYNPEILKRYVNFMSNPDEQTAVAQFGKDDKYFGVATLLVTLPGLPMFAHGQVEGFAEKYGMEYRRSYHDEIADDNLVRRHEREIFPLLGKRHLFSQVNNFELYDFHDSRGFVNENVFVYSNLSGHERAVICFHNKYEECNGWVNFSVGKTSTAGEEGGRIMSKHLAEALQLKKEEGVFYVFREHISNLEFLRTGAQLHDEGLYFHLKAFQYQVFLDFREVRDARGDYRLLWQSLNGSGVPRIHDELESLVLAPVHNSFRQLFTDGLQDFVAMCNGQKSGVSDLVALYRRFMEASRQRLQANRHIDLPVETFERYLDSIVLLAREFERRGRKERFSDSYKLRGDAEQDSRLGLALLALAAAAEMVGGDPLERQAGAFMETLAIARPLLQMFADANGNLSHAAERVELVRILVSHQSVFRHEDRNRIFTGVCSLLDEEDVRAFLGVNLYEQVWYFNKERFDELVVWLFTLAVVQTSSEKKEIDIAKRIELGFGSIESFRRSSDASRYMLDKLRSMLLAEGQELAAPAGRK